MLAGQVPFVGSVMQVMSQHLNKLPPFERLENVPPSVAAILRRMLEKDRANRYQTPLELRTAVESCLAEISDEPPPVWVPLTDEVMFPPPSHTPPSHAIAEAQPSKRGVDVGSVLAARYEISAALGETNLGRTFRATDRQSQGDVCLLVLQPDVLQDTVAYTALEQETEKFIASPHPNILAVRAIETVEDSSFVVLEWINGFSLLDLLRARRVLGSDEVLLFLRQAAAGVDAALTSPLEGLTFELRQVQLHFPSGCDKTTLLQTPVTEWPAFELKLYPLSVELESRIGQTWAGGQTMVGGSAADVGKQELRVRYLQSLAATIYELLGGTRPLAGRSGPSSPIPARYAPLSTLSEEGNEVLKRALDPVRTFQTAREFCEALATNAGMQAHRHEIKHSSTSPVAPPPSVAPPPAPMAPASAAPPSVPPRSAPTPFPPAAKRKLPLVPIGIAAGVAVLVVGAGLFFLLHTGPSGGSVAKVDVPNPPVATPAPAPSDPNRQKNLTAQVQSAQQVESKGAWPKSLEAWAQVAKDFPEARTAFDRLEALLSQLRNRANPLTKEEFKAGRPAVLQAAQLGVPSAMMLLGDDLRDQDPTSAFNWYSAASAKGHIPALTSLGVMFGSGAGTSPDFAKAVKCFQDAAEKGDPFGCFALAECYLTGRGVSGKDERRALDLLRTAANAGDVYAMNRLADCLAHGVGGKPDFAEAARLFTQASDAGHLEALGNLGVLYVYGNGVPSNPKRATELFEKGARAGSSYCMALLASSLENGVGVAKNQAMAQNWYMEAAKAGEKGTVSPYPQRKFNVARR
jgi:TPR repeat protein